MGSLGLPELLIVLVIVLLVFGVGRLPEVGGALGKGLREFRRASRDDAEDEETGPAESSPAHRPTSPTTPGPLRRH